VYAPPRDSYAVLCRHRVTLAPDLEGAARHLADAHRSGSECRVMACATVHRHREPHGWERERLIELATSFLIAPA
jgi:hypothetical protein